ncbi:hypothetical protein KP509_05G034100 [Ceratopteris richardii]|uniref:Uncharacterized protein n=1 Tax=Ceratopteris richardii TaxID=49495 RepID=A0A8T2UT02_CERRI|nr:hypothetical protein KP509_05G034100 [Ceratopteris richardii]
MALSCQKPCSRIMRGPPQEIDYYEDAFRLPMGGEKRCYEGVEGDGEEEEETKQSADENGVECSPNSQDGDEEYAQHPTPRQHEKNLHESSNGLPSSDHVSMRIAAQEGHSFLKVRYPHERYDGMRSPTFHSRTTEHLSSLYPSITENSCSPGCQSQSPRGLRKALMQKHKWGFFSKESRKVEAEQDHRDDGTNSLKKSAFAGSSFRYLLPREGFSMLKDVDIEKRRNSSASLHDMAGFRDALECREKLGKHVSWEEEVRQAMARSFVDVKKGEEAPRQLQRSTSSREYRTCMLPPTLLIRRNRNDRMYDSAADMHSSLFVDESGSGAAEKRKNVRKGIWRGFSMKCPSEERWEEAAVNEERQQLWRRARCSSTRYDEFCTADPMDDRRTYHRHCNEDDGDGWAIYKRSGYVNLPPRPDSDIRAASAGSRVGRSASMRDTRMGLLMECATCGEGLVDGRGGGPVLCICPCCGATRAIAGQSNSGKKKKSGIIKACRRLLGLGKKHHSDIHHL